MSCTYHKSDQAYLCLSIHVPSRGKPVGEAIVQAINSAYMIEIN